MKVNELKTMIRKIVREEVAMTIKEVVKEIKSPPAKKPTITKAKRTRQVLEQESKPNVTFSRNKIINDVLNETANDNDWQTMGGETYTTDKAHEVLQNSYGDMMNAPVGGSSNGVNPDAMIASMGMNPSTVPDKAKEIFTKDYSKLMKKVSKK